MITQFKILFFFLCINVVSMVVLGAYTGTGFSFPFVDYTHPLNSTGTIDEYEENFNGSALVGGESGAGGWNPVGGYGFAGDIFSALNMFWQVFRFLVDGLPLTLEWIGSMIPVASTAFTLFAYVLRILTAVMTTTLVIEFISGRVLLE
jgi:hypothetical protein